VHSAHHGRRTTAILMHVLDKIRGLHIKPPSVVISGAPSTRSSTFRKKYSMQTNYTASDLSEKYIYFSRKLQISSGYPKLIIQTEKAW
jgi:hypothetical protein